MLAIGGRALIPVDVALLGAGPAACVCAWQLRKSGLRVALVGRKRAAARLGEVCGPNVLRSLSAAGFELPSMPLGLPVSCHESAWGSNELESRDLRFWHAGDALAVDRPRFDAWLLDAVRSTGALVFDDCLDLAGGYRDAQWRIQGQGSDGSFEIATDFVAEATGRVGRSMLLPVVRRLYFDHLVCSYAAVEDVAPAAARGRASLLVEATADGWWYTTRDPDGQRIVAFFTDADLVPPDGRRQAAFWALLSRTRHAGALCGRPTEGQQVQVCDARTSARNLIWRGNWMSFGDAAWSIDPLSGSGISRAINDGFAAATSITQALTSGDMEVLRRHALKTTVDLGTAMRQQRGIYRVERRWAEAPFWRRRNAAVNSAIAPDHTLPPAV